MTYHHNWSAHALGTYCLNCGVRKSYASKYIVECVKQEKRTVPDRIIDNIAIALLILLSLAFLFRWCLDATLAKYNNRLSVVEEKIECIETMRTQINQLDFIISLPNNS